MLVMIHNFFESDYKAIVSSPDGLVFHCSSCGWAFAVTMSELIFLHARTACMYCERRVWGLTYSVRAGAKQRYFPSFLFLPGGMRLTVLGFAIRDSPILSSCLEPADAHWSSY